MKNLFHLFLIALFLLVSIAQAETVTLPSEQEISIEEYGKATAKQQILWMHSERGISGELQKTLLNITKKQDIQILLPDWLDSYFIEPSRSALEKIPQQDFEDLITHYSKQNDQLFIVVDSRTASLVLNAVHHLQTQGIKPVAGIVLIGPYLQKQTPEIGQSIEYQEIASHSNLPLYVFQAERSPRYVPLPHLIMELEKGGSPVYTHVLKNITGGFYARDQQDLTMRDMQARQEFPKQIANALSILAQTEASPLKEMKRYERNIRKKRLSHLQAVSLKTPELVLKDLQGRTHKLTDYKGKAVLVSYWASWCRPCIEEMPSLVKLKEKYKDKLEILAINVREDKATIEQFTKAMNINFPILQDKNSSTVENWKVYVYPSNFIVDNNGKLRYAATGAMDWQDSEIENILEGLWK